MDWGKIVFRERISSRIIFIQIPLDINLSPEFETVEFFSGEDVEEGVAEAETSHVRFLAKDCHEVPMLEGDALPSRRRLNDPDFLEIQSTNVTQFGGTRNHDFSHACPQVQ